MPAAVEPPRVSAPGPPRPSLIVFVKFTPAVLLIDRTLYGPETVVGPLNVNEAPPASETAPLFRTTGFASETAPVVVVDPIARLVVSVPLTRFSAPLPAAALLLRARLLP